MAEQLRAVNSGDFSSFVVDGIEVPWQDLMLAPFERYCRLTDRSTFVHLLKREGIDTLLDLASCSEEFLRSIHQLGTRGIETIKSELAKLGLRLPDEGSTSLYAVLVLQLIKAGLTLPLAAELVATPKALQRVVGQANNLVWQRTGTSLLPCEATPANPNGTPLRSAYSQDDTPVTIGEVSYQWQTFLGLGIEVLEPLTETHQEHTHKLLLSDNIKTVRGLLSCRVHDLQRIKGMKGKLVSQLVGKLEGFGLRIAMEDEIERPMMVGIRRKVGLRVFLELRPSEIDLHPDLDKPFSSVQNLLAANPQDLTKLLGEPASWQNFLVQSLREEVTRLTTAD